MTSPTHPLAQPGEMPEPNYWDSDGYRCENGVRPTFVLKEDHDALRTAFAAMRQERDEAQGLLNCASGANADLQQKLAALTLDVRELLSQLKAAEARALAAEGEALERAAKHCEAYKAKAIADKAFTEALAAQWLANEIRALHQPGGAGGAKS